MSNNVLRKLNETIDIIMSIKKKLFKYLFILRESESESKHVSGGRAERDRETQNLKQASGSELSAQSPTWGSDSRTSRSWPQLKSVTLLTEPPRRPYTDYFGEDNKWNVTSFPTALTFSTGMKIISHELGFRTSHHSS